MANFEPTEAQVDNLIGLLDGYAEKGGPGDGNQLCVER